MEFDFDSGSFDFDSENLDFDSEVLILSPSARGIDSISILIPGKSPLSPSGLFTTYSTTFSYDFTTFFTTPSGEFTTFSCDYFANRGVVKEVVFLFT